MRECCKKSPVITSYSGERLCKEHFALYFEKKVRKTIRTNKLVGKKEKVLVACSGGKDSTTVLYLLDNVVKNKNVSIEAIHIDVGVGKYSEENLKNIKTFCKKNRIKLHLTSFREELGGTLCYLTSILKSKGINWKSCMVCGIFKRYILNKKARELKATVLATGHNLDDEAQSILMNLFKNHVEMLPRLGPKTGIKEFKGFIPRIKPLYFCLEEEVKLYSEIMKFPVKYEKCPCRETAYRKDVAQMLNDFEKKFGGTKNGIINSFLEILPALKKEYSKGTVNVCEKCGEPAAQEICNRCKIIALLKK